MNAENRKLMFGLVLLDPQVTQHLTLFHKYEPHSRWKCHNGLQLSLVSESEADAEATAQCVTEVQRALELTSAGVITHPSVDSSPL